MSRKSLVVILILVAATGAVVYFVTGNRSQGMVLTGIVTTDEVIVSSQIAGRLDQVLVKEGDTVTAGQLLATDILLRRPSDLVELCRLLSELVGQLK